MSAGDYTRVPALWEACEGLGLSDSDSQESIARYLDRDPGLSQVAWDNGSLVGAVLCGHDGRRGYIHHLAVRPSHRRAGIGRGLVGRCLDALRSAGISKCHVFVFSRNQEALRFWKDAGWTQRGELVMMSRYPHRALAEPLTCEYNSPGRKACAGPDGLGSVSSRV